MTGQRPVHLVLAMLDWDSRILLTLDIVDVILFTSYLPPPKKKWPCLNRHPVCYHQNGST